MARAKKICAKPGCPSIAAGSYCDTHQAEAERARGSRESRGYGPEHRALRKTWAPRVATGSVLCARCQQPILPGKPWALDHSDDRADYLGPSHKFCNDSAGGKAAHR